jgi:hypothetical protein
VCSMYWSVWADVVCPSCGLEQRCDLQTHFMGEPGSCVNYYELGEPVEELAGVEAATLNGENDDFCAFCTCGKFWLLGARIENGAVVAVWALPDKEGAE